MERKSLFDPNTFAEIASRIGALTPESKPEWGKMGVGQMLAHCSEIIEVSLGKELKGTPFLIRLIAPLIRRGVLSEKPYRRDSPTHPQYIVTDPADFAIEKTRLLAALDRSVSPEAEAATHPLFGTFSREDAGWVGYKHLNHHLTQFGV